MADGASVPNPAQQFDRICERLLIGRAIVIVMILAAGGLLLENINETTTIGPPIFTIGVILGAILRVFTLKAFFIFFYNI